MHILRHLEILQRDRPLEPAEDSEEEAEEAEMIIFREHMNEEEETAAELRNVGRETDLFELRLVELERTIRGVRQAYDSLEWVFDRLDNEGMDLPPAYDPRQGGRRAYPRPPPDSPPPPYDGL